MEYTAQISGEDLEWFANIVNLYSVSGETVNITVRSDGTIAVGTEEGMGWVSNRVSDYL